MKKYYYAIIYLLLLTSCSYNGTFQGLYSYYNKTKNENPGLFIKVNDTMSICNLRSDIHPKIYITNANKIKNCLKQSKSAIVYIWKPKCSSKFCTPLEIVEEKCKLYNIDLFIVAEYYDLEMMSKNYKITRPILGIDTEYYKSNLTEKYLTNFVNDLTLKKHNNIGNFIHFKNGIYINNFESFDLLEFMCLKN